MNDLDPNGVDEQIASRNNHLCLVNALRKLPRRQRDCLALHYLLELTVAEIAETLDLSPNSVKTHLKRGLVSLRIDPDLLAGTEEDR
jgi:RNA polymerase sigma factor (sigma-70 family)